MSKKKPKPKKLPVLGNYEIVWQKNENLFESAEEKLHKANAEAEKELEENDDYDINDEEFETESSYEDDEPRSVGRQPFLFTGDGGAVPVHEYFPSGKIYNFWIGYTNFPITDDVMDIIDFTDGIETLERFTRYRMRVGVGKLFKTGEVLSAVRKNVKEFLNKVNNE